MDLKEKAKIFAINAHMWQIKKSELDNPRIIHPISVDMLLEEYVNRNYSYRAYNKEATIDKELRVGGC